MGQLRSRKFLAENATCNHKPLGLLMEKNKAECLQMQIYLKLSSLCLLSGRAQALLSVPLQIGPELSWTLGSNKHRPVLMIKI